MTAVERPCPGQQATGIGYTWGVRLDSRRSESSTFARHTLRQTLLSIPWLAAWTAATVAIAACGGAEASPPEKAMEAYELGQERQEHANLAGAFDAYTLAIQLDPQMAEAYSYRGYVYYRYNQLDSAISDLNRAIDLDPDLASAYHHRGLVMASQELVDDGILSFTRAIQLDSTLQDAYYQRARLNYRLEDFDAVIDDLSAAIELDPQSERFYMLRGQVYLIIDEPGLAIPDLERVIAISENEDLVVAAKQLLSMAR